MGNPIDPLLLTALPTVCLSFGSQAAMSGIPKAERIMNASGLVVRTWNDAPISRRDSDGYADATAMCQANGKLYADYQRLERTTAYIQALGESLGLPADQLVLTTTSGPNHLRGTWVHPRLAVDLARWLSPQFAVWMDGWFLEQLEQHRPAPAPVMAGPSITDLELLLDQRICGLIKEHLPTAAATPAIPIPASIDELPPLSEWILETIHERRAKGLPVTSKDIWQEPGCEWAGNSVYNRVAMLRRQKLVRRHGRGLHLTAAAERLLAAAAVAAA